jgi:hypothetical protein
MSSCRTRRPLGDQHPAVGVGDGDVELAQGVAAGCARPAATGVVWSRPVRVGGEAQEPAGGRGELLVDLGEEEPAEGAGQRDVGDEQDQRDGGAAEQHPPAQRHHGTRRV